MIEPLSSNPMSRENLQAMCIRDLESALERVTLSDDIKIARMIAADALAKYGLRPADEPLPADTPRMSRTADETLYPTSGNLVGDADETSVVQKPLEIPFGVKPVNITTTATAHPHKCKDGNVSYITYGMTCGNCGFETL